MTKIVMTHVTCSGLDVGNVKGGKEVNECKEEEEEEEEEGYTLFACWRLRAFFYSCGYDSYSYPKPR